MVSFIENWALRGYINTWKKKNGEVISFVTEDFTLE